MKRVSYLFLLSLVTFFSAPFIAVGALFNVANPTEFQNALTKAQSNGENDTILVAPGTYNIASTLSYTTQDGDGSLTIQAKDMKNRPVLDGGNKVQIMSIENDSDGGYGGDEGNLITIKGMVFQSGNTTTGWGGGLYIKAGQANLSVIDNTFIGNRGDSGGGAFLLSYYGTITLTGNTFSKNSATKDGGGARVEIVSGRATIAKNIFNEGSVNYSGGALWVATDSGPLMITNNIFKKNSALQGGAIWINTFSGTPSLTNNTFFENSAETGGAAGVQIYHDMAALNIYNNIFWNNTTASYIANSGDDLYVVSDWDSNGTGATVNLYNNDFGPNSDFTTGQSEDLYITVTDHYNHASNIKSNPLFSDPSHGDFHLSPNSPCIDKGLNSAPNLPSGDFEGNSRKIDGDGDGNATVDMGADEYIPQGGNYTTQSNADGLGIAVVRMKDNGNVYLYVPSLILSGGGGTNSIYSILFELEAIEGIIFRMEDFKALSKAPGPISAFFDPGQELLYIAYVALIDQKGSTTIYKNLTFFVTIGDDGNGGSEVFINLRDLLGDQAPTITEYREGTNQMGSGAPPEASNYYLATMAYIENLLKGTSFTTPKAPSSSTTFNWDISDWQY